MNIDTYIKDLVFTYYNNGFENYIVINELDSNLIVFYFSENDILQKSNNIFTLSNEYYYVTLDKTNFNITTVLLGSFDGFYDISFNSNSLVYSNNTNNFVEKNELNSFASFDFNNNYSRDISFICFMLVLFFCCWFVILNFKRFFKGG